VIGVIKHFIIVVSGKVQGVFFRASAKEKAEQLNIKGFAQNQSDGSVRIEAEGDEENLKQFVDWCRMGPPRAQVTNIEIREGDLKNYSRFEIKR
jgi:acylphosphatase